MIFTHLLIASYIASTILSVVHPQFSITFKDIIFALGFTQTIHFQLSPAAAMVQAT
jgi:hypothetical protein